MRGQRAWIRNGPEAVSLSLQSQKHDSMRPVGQDGRARLFASGHQGQHERQSGAHLELHANSRHFRKALRAPPLPVREAGRLDDDQEERQDRGGFQRPWKSLLHFHALVQGRRLRAEPDRRQSPSHVRSRFLF